MLLVSSDTVWLLLYNSLFTHCTVGATELILGGYESDGPGPEAQSRTNSIADASSNGESKNIYSW